MIYLWNLLPHELSPGGVLPHDLPSGDLRPSFGGSLSGDLKAAHYKMRLDLRSASG